jgi:hypothetical protein
MGQASDRSDAFSERLQRIESKNTSNRAASEASAGQAPVRTGAATRPLGRARVVLILLTMLGLFGAGAITILNMTEDYEQATAKPVVVRR